MRKRIICTTALLLTLSLLPGCPGAGNQLVGSWIVTADFLNDTFGLQLNANGTATSFNAPILLLGDFTWEVNGTEFILRQEYSGSWNSYIARVTSDTFLQGGWVTWEGGLTGNGGVWSAVKQ